MGFNPISLPRHGTLCYPKKMRKFTVQLDDIRVRYLNRPYLTDSLREGVRLAVHHNHSGARVLARVLLSAYNGHRFPFDVSDLALLDEKHTELAFSIMRLRSLGHEPHNFFHNGGQLFEDMAAAWGFEEA
jgi:hypothetical protein